jgi:epoxyqueuosine reductase
MHHLSQFKEKIKAEALRLGFTRTGIAPAHPAPHYQEYLEWISTGNYGDMHYLSRADTLAKRADPQLILEGCQRVICLAIPYHQPQAPQNKCLPGHGRISAYARTSDYHTIVQDRLSELEAFIHDLTGGTTALRSYVDTGPILERAYASAAGIGAPGKNTNLILPGAGSYFFLAEILTDLALPVDEPFTRDLCGSCQRCVEACPTGCILPNRTIDANRCISFLTIENKGAIPDEMKSRVGNWFFGCDICQMVCPHNTRTDRQPDPLDKSRLSEFINLTEMLTWEPKAFTDAFQDTALTRTKPRGLIRNAAVVLGNQGDRNALPLLKDMLTRESDPVIQDASHWAIHQIEGDQE